MSENLNSSTSNPNQEVSHLEDVVHPLEVEVPAPVLDESGREPQVIDIPEVTNVPTSQIRKTKVGKKSNVLAKQTVEEFKSIEHLKSYRLYSEGKSAALDIAIIRVIDANVKPIMKSIRDSRILLSTRFITNSIDRVTLSMILLGERMLPSMKTIGTKDIWRSIATPVVVPIRLAIDVQHAAIETATYFVYRPYHNELTRFRHFYNRKLIDTKNKPLIRGSVDPIIKPLNDSIENIVMGRFPDLLAKQRKDFCCETSRSTMLVYVATEGSKLATVQHMKHKMMMPCVMIRKSNEIFNEHLDKQEDLGMRSVLKAVDGAFKQIEKESIEYLRNMMRPRRFRKKSATKATNVQPSEEEAEFHILPIGELNQTHNQHSAAVEGA